MTPAVLRAGARTPNVTKHDSSHSSNCSHTFGEARERDNQRDDVGRKKWRAISPECDS